MQHVEELERLLDTFQESAEKAVKVKQERDRLKERVKTVRDSHDEARESLKALKETKHRLKNEVTGHEQKIQRLKKRLDPGEDDDAEWDEEEFHFSADDRTQPDPEPSTPSSTAPDAEPEQTRAESGEVELSDPDTPADDLDTIRSIKEDLDTDDSQDVEAWSGFEPGNEEDATSSDIRKRIVGLEHENKKMRAALQETEDVLKRLHQRSEEVDEHLDD